jgi:hypothetical protein
LEINTSNIIKKETAWKYYHYNLLHVLYYVKKLFPYLEGKIIITADHGNAFGFGGIYFGHPWSSRIPPLVEVPWLECN